jgi:hypothetical protein
MTMTIPESELLRRANARKEYIKELTRCRRIAVCLTAAIRSHNRLRAQHWQQISSKHYGDHFWDWVASQTDLHGMTRAEIESRPRR